MSEVPQPTRRARRAEGEPVAVVSDGVVPALAAQDVVGADDDRGRLATAQLEMAAFGDHLVPYVPPVPKPPPSWAPWALTLATAALISSIFWGWLLPLSVVAAVAAIVSLRRRHDRRSTAVWALALAVLSGAFSAGWLVWGLAQLAGS